jgi:hypothetical protein
MAVAKKAVVKKVVKVSQGQGRGRLSVRAGAGNWAEFHLFEEFRPSRTKRRCSGVRM